MIDFIVKYWLQFVFGIIATIIATMFKRIESYKKKLDSTQSGVKALLKTRIIENYTRIIERGFITLEEKESINDMYNEYKNLGGNGVVSDVINELSGLEIKTACKVVNK